jgi:hypothetical protein
MKRVVVFIAVLIAIAVGIGWQAGGKISNGLRTDSSGGLVESVETCTTAAPITVSATTTQIVPVGAAMKIRICRAVIARTDTAAVVATVKFVEGTGTNCATGQTAATGVVAAFPSATPGTVYFGGNPGGSFTTAVAGDALCVTEVGAASSMDVTITYVQY